MLAGWTSAGRELEAGPAANLNSAWPSSSLSTATRKGLSLDMGLSVLEGCFGSFICKSVINRIVRYRMEDKKKAFYP